MRLEQVNNIGVLVRATTKNSIEEYGDPAKFLEDNQYLLGKQVFLGEFCGLVVCVINLYFPVESCQGGHVHQDILEAWSEFWTLITTYLIIQHLAYVLALVRCSSTYASGEC